VKTARPNKLAVARRDAPDLPRDLEPAACPEGLFENGDLAELNESRLNDLDRPDLRLGTFRMEGCVLDRIRLAGGHFSALVWKDVRLTACDLSNIRAHRVSLVRVEFIDCKLAGLRTHGLEGQDVLISNCDVRYAQFQGGKLHATEFEQSNCQEADFQGTDLSGSIFRSCKMERADLRGAKLRKTDFRGSEVEGMLVGIEDLRGAIADAAQAMIFARLLGLEIS
jgi:uncharacterized protein YjbI with pentapeptide repeats